MASDGFDPLAKTNFSLARRRTFFSFKIPIHDFHEQNNLFHLNSIRCKDRHRCYNYIGSTTITVVFASGRNCHTTSQLAAEKHSFLSKCRFTISREHNNSFHYNLFPSCKHKHRYYIDIIQIFEHLRFFNCLKACVTSRCCVHETWSLEFRMISRMTNHYLQVVHLSFVAFYKQKSQPIIRRFN